MANFLLSQQTAPSLKIRPAKSTPNLQQRRTFPWPSSFQSSSDPYQPRSLVGAVRNTLKDANDAWLSWRDGKSAEERKEWKRKQERKQILIVRLKNAESFKQWEAAAKELDHLEDNEQWKRDLSPSSIPSDFNPSLIEQRLRQLDRAREDCDLRMMMHLVRTALSRDLGGMGNVALYRHSYTGTKKLIERYVDSTLQTIEAIIAQSGVSQEAEPRDLLESMILSRQSFGRSALMLSGGGAFGMSHIGVVKALYEADLLPRIISGASAGSIVCAVICTQTDDEVPKMLKTFPHGDLAVFSDPAAGVLDRCRHILTEGTWADIKYLSSVMQKETQNMTFQEAYNRTRRILNICVSTSSMFELPRLLNYATAPNVLIWSAVAASCSLPGVFNGSPLLAKDPVTGEHGPWTPSPQNFIDGSVDNDLPTTRLSEMFNVNHFIVSQVNPHIVPFLSKDDHLSPDGTRTAQRPTSADDLDWTYVLATLARDETVHRLHVLTEMNILPHLFTKVRSILSQKYSGDITILPEISMHDFPRFLSNPTPEFMLRSCLIGEKATWPKLSRIKDRCAIELALDRAVRKLRTRVVFSQSQRDLRSLAVSVGNMRLMPNGGTPSRPGGKRHRRRSGGSLQLYERDKVVAFGVTIDKDADVPKGLIMETNKRRSEASNQEVPREAKRRVLKRASKSHVYVSDQLNKWTGGLGFSESSPQANFKAFQLVDGQASQVDMGRAAAEDMDTEEDLDVETSEITEMGQSSDAGDADGEQDIFTEDSEVDDDGLLMQTNQATAAMGKPNNRPWN